MYVITILVASASVAYCKFSSWLLRVVCWYPYTLAWPLPERTCIAKLSTISLTLNDPILCYMLHISSVCSFKYYIDITTLVTSKTNIPIQFITMYRISSNRRPGVYFLRDSVDPAFKQGRRLNGAGVYLLHVFLAYTHPRYVAHAEVEI